MQIIRKIFSGLILVLSFSSLPAQVDSANISDPTVLFFHQNEKLSKPAETKLVTKANKIIALPAFLAGLGIYSDYVLNDLDHDGKKELLISNYTGGAHCCDEIYIFKYMAPNRFQHVVKFFAGNTTITGKKEFIYDFYEQFGYFFSCFACAYTDTTDEAPIGIHNIILKYSKGKMMVVPGDRELRNTITDNLGKLGEQPYEKLEDASAFDNGLRKEFAINLAVFYYSFGRNMPETQKLFNKYYKFPDAKKVWDAFVKQLQYIKKDNDF